MSLLEALLLHNYPRLWHSAVWTSLPFVLGAVAALLIFAVKWYARAQRDEDRAWAYRLMWLTSYTIAIAMLMFTTRLLMTHTTAAGGEARIPIHQIYLTMILLAAWVAATYCTFVMSRPPAPLPFQEGRLTAVYLPSGRRQARHYVLLAVAFLYTGHMLGVIDHWLPAAAGATIYSGPLQWAMVGLTMLFLAKAYLARRAAKDVAVLAQKPGAALVPAAPAEPPALPERVLLSRKPADQTEEPDNLPVQRVA